MTKFAYDFEFHTIDGAPLPLETYRDKVMLVVNTASQCGLTPQYEGLEKLYSDYKDQGLVVLGVPCNQFAGQEPGTEAEIKDFCETKFNIDFPLTAKADVKGDTAHPFYKWAKDVLGEPAEPVWNFHKILVGKDGKLIRAFGPRTEPLDDEVVGAVKAAL
ncbi:MAG: glutathione peroxidase [Pseudomonadota bacterium]|jgi:glutathione peroxidase|uniref:glutathione peroxidase n=1 Tax=unclassified Phenylobacterium TaxID=2640670 RepID=UPI0006FAC647|nr:MULTISPECIES: glutathione peroxidase [unclassified Phenylobacterium]KRB40117.1 glutathione peroxidase [Phenylobacterium sp. Root700]MBT9469778.1 glutathione peroxidase [Phenylobacterium sp.]